MTIHKTVLPTALLSAMAFSVTACSGGQPANQGLVNEARAAEFSPAQTSSDTIPNPKVFAGRYNSLAPEGLKITEIADNSYSKHEHYTSLELQSKVAGPITLRVEAKSYSFSPDHPQQLGLPVLKQVCSWLARSVDPSITEAEAAEMASRVIDSNAKVTVGNNIMTWYGNYNSGCEVHKSGL